MTPAPDHRTSRPLLSRLRAVADLYTYPLRLSHYAELVNPLWSTHKLQARVVEIWDETRNSRTLTLKPGLNWRGHRAGQHVRVGIPANGKHYTRTYTISSPPEREDDCFTITVKAIDKGTISHHIVRNIKVGDYLPIGLPQGERARVFGFIPHFDYSGLQLMGGPQRIHQIQIMGGAQVQVKVIGDGTQTRPDRG